MCFACLPACLIVSLTSPSPLPPSPPPPLPGSEILCHPYLTENPAASPSLASLQRPGPLLLQLAGPSDCSYFPRAAAGSPAADAVVTRPSWWPPKGAPSAGRAGTAGDAGSRGGAGGKGGPGPSEGKSSGTREESKDEFGSFTTVGSMT